MRDVDSVGWRVDGRVVGLLAGQLLASPRFRCPGADGASAGDVVAAEYPAAAAAGWVPRPAELAARHPELADALGAFFRGAAPAGTARSPAPPAGGRSPRAGGALRPAD